MSGAQTRLNRNTLWMMLSRFGAQGLAVIFTILLAQRLGAEGFGEYAFIAALLFITNALTMFGTDMLLIREIAGQGNLSRLAYALVLQLALSALFISLFWLFGARIPNQSMETITALRIYSLALIPLAFFTMFTTALRGVQRLDMYSLLNLIVSALQVGVVLLPEISILRLSILLVLAQIAAAILAGLICSYAIRNFWQSWRFSPMDLPSFLREAAPIAFLAMVTMLYQRLSIGMLSILMGATITGIFSAAFRAVEASKTAHLAVFAALYPAMAENMSLRLPLGRSNPPPNDEIASSGFDARVSTFLTTTYSKLLIVGAVGISFLLFVLAKPLVILLYGHEFILSSSVLQILAWLLIPFTINTYLTLSFLASGREHLIGRALTVSLLGLLILNLWWIPAKGVGGSAWATLVAECFQSVLLLASARLPVHVQGEVRELSELS